MRLCVNRLTKKHKRQNHNIKWNDLFDLTTTGGLENQHIVNINEHIFFFAWKQVRKLAYN